MKSLFSGERGEEQMQTKMLEEMKTIVKKETICVLATVSEGKPHCSLMSYVSDEEGREIYMTSHRKTKKFANLRANPSVSLLVDTREEDRGSKRANVRALTVEGEFQKIVGLYGPMNHLQTSGKSSQGTKA